MQLLLTAFLALDAHAEAQDVQQNLQTEAAARVHPLLWELKGAKNSVFLFGSIHVAKPDFYPLPAYVENAYKKADTLAVEVDPSAPDVAARMVPYLTYKAADNLQNHLTPATWQKLSAKLGPAVEQMKALKPAMLSVVMAVGLYGELGYRSEAGIDVHFISRARLDRKSLVELESIEFQASVLGGLDDSDGEAMLADVLDGFENGEAVEYVNGLAAAWQKGDADGLVELLTKEAGKDPGSARMMKLLIDDRNPGMANKIARLFRDGKNVFVVIGAGHLVGRGSVVELLQKQGLDVRQVK
ncbi:TraB/GumN family protein [Undibacterium sp.]|uniref:TraB/GumN family protein n=1 Tax=Undibacterium sp. TaxID=1914977 RepID=UPI002BBB4DD5|nr:TraB/GumN family protein [Undibacterium sp.]HTD06712.1 TraB/GumN family protein [Undibacterium sp.]